MQKKLIFIFLMIFLGFNLENAQTKNRMREEIVRDTIILNSYKWLSNARIFYSYIKYAPADGIHRNYKDASIFYITSKKDSILKLPFEMKVLELVNFKKIKFLTLLDEKTSVKYFFRISENEKKDNFTNLNLENFKVGETAKEGTIIGNLININKKNQEKLFKFRPVIAYYDREKNKDVDLYFFKSSNLTKLILDW